MDSYESFNRKEADKMIVILKHGVSESDIEELCSALRSEGADVRVHYDDSQVLLSIPSGNISEETLCAIDIVESVTGDSAPYRKASRRSHAESTVIEITNTVKFGSGFPIIAGPCTVESREQILSIAAAVKAGGASILRGGAFKPRTSPYDFQGLHAKGIKLLIEAKRETGMPVITEIMDIAHLPLFEDVDIIQVGARNMQNYELLKELGRTNKPILLKRGMSSTLKELLMSAEYVMAGGNGKVILCERGIRTFETYTRNTLDLSAVPMLHELTHLPVIVDPSHATGMSRLVKPMATAAAACGADGIMIEVHTDPVSALCDGPQALTPAEFSETVRAIGAVRSALGF